MLSLFQRKRLLPAIDATAISLTALPKRLTRPESAASLLASPIKTLGDEYRRELLYCGHPLGLKDDLSATENLQSSMALADESVTQDAAYQALCQAGLLGREHLSVRALSQGQKRRVNLARLVLQKRALWVLDEPLTALDAQASQWVMGEIDSHLSRGGIAVLTTHQEIALAGKTQLIRVGA